MESLLMSLGSFGIIFVAVITLMLIFIGMAPMVGITFTLFIAGVGLIVGMVVNELKNEYLTPEVFEVIEEVKLSLSQVKRYNISELRNIEDGFFFQKNNDGQIDLPKSIKFTYKCNNIIEQYVIDAQDYPQSFFEKSSNGITLPGKFLLHKFFLIPSFKTKPTNQTKVLRYKKYYLKDCRNLEKYVEKISLN